MVDREIIEEWITKADEDFEFARINLEEDKPFILKRDILFTGLFTFLKKRRERLVEPPKKSAYSSRKN